MGLISLQSAVKPHVHDILPAIMLFRGIDERLADALAPLCRRNAQGENPTHGFKCS